VCSSDLAEVLNWRVQKLLLKPSTTATH